MSYSEAAIFTRLGIKEGEILGPLTTYGIGGPARYFAKAESIDELSSLLNFAKAKQIPVFILGKGSNTIFDDRGFNGLVILVKLRAFTLSQEGKVKVDAGFSFARLGTVCSQKGWTGLEFACGIPGSVGGAVYMNAGASGSDTSLVLTSVQFMDQSGEVHEVSKEDLHFSYRHSSFQERPGIILRAEFLLKLDEEAKARQKNILQKRIQSQPYDQKSAGCVFRNPTATLSAGAMIDQVGLKGFAIGAMEVSPLHANFLVNRGGGTSSDLFSLIHHVKEEVRKKFQVDLELEIRKVDFEPRSWWVDAVAR